MRAATRSPYTGLLERVVYESEDGRVADDVADLLSDAATVSLPNLALILANPSLELSFIPRSLWVGVRLRRAIDRWPAEADSDPEEIQERFAGSVGRCLGDADTVAVAVSGGLDSLAVLHHAGLLCQVQRRRLVALVGDLEDDRGRRCAPIVREAIEALGIDCTMRVFGETTGTEAATSWSPAGPTFEAMPDVCLRIAEEAYAAGAELVLSGRGSDEQLMCTRFTALALRRRGRVRVLRRYLADMGHYDGARGLFGEVSSLVSPVLGPRRGFQLLYGVMWANAHEPDRACILASRHGEHAARVHAEWVAAQRAMVEEHGHDWPAIAARCAIYPRDNTPPAGPLPWVSPFLEPEFVRYASRLDVAARYDEALPHAYHRVKAAVVRLFPAAARHALPTEKQTFARAGARYGAATASDTPGRCLELGLLADDWRGAIARDDRLTSVVAMVERWVRGCDDRGHGFSDAVAEAPPAPASGT